MNWVSFIWSLFNYDIFPISLDSKDEKHSKKLHPERKCHRGKLTARKVKDEKSVKDAPLSKKMEKKALSTETSCFDFPDVSVVKSKKKHACVNDVEKNMLKTKATKVLAEEKIFNEGFCGEEKEEHEAMENNVDSSKDVISSTDDKASDASCVIASGMPLLEMSAVTEENSNELTNSQIFTESMIEKYVDGNDLQNFLNKKKENSQKLSKTKVVSKDDIEGHSCDRKEKDVNVKNERKEGVVKHKKIEDRKEKKKIEDRKEKKKIVEKNKTAKKESVEKEKTKLKEKMVNVSHEENAKNHNTYQENGRFAIKPCEGVNTGDSKASGESNMKNSTSGQHRSKETDEVPAEQKKIWISASFEDNETPQKGEVASKPIDDQDFIKETPGITKKKNNKAKEAKRPENTMLSKAKQRSVPKSSVPKLVKPVLPSDEIMKNKENKPVPALKKPSFKAPVKSVRKVTPSFTAPKKKTVGGKRPIAHIEQELEIGGSTC